MLSHVLPAQPVALPNVTTPPIRRATKPDTGTAGRWSVVDDPDRWRRFVLMMIDAHHRVRVPGCGADQCSCGRPFMLCPIGPLAHELRYP